MKPVTLFNKPAASVSKFFAIINDFNKGFLQQSAKSAAININMFERNGCWFR